MTMITKAQHIAILAHDGQEDKGGQPYWRHPQAVARWVQILGGSDEAIAAAWLHDVLEDTTWIVEDLSGAGMSERTIALTVALTHPKHQPRAEYIRGILEHEDDEVPLIKFADTLHNLQPDRVAALSPTGQENSKTRYVPVLSALARRLWP